MPFIRLLKIAGSFLRRGVFIPLYSLFTITFSYGQTANPKDVVIVSVDRSVTIDTSNFSIGVTNTGDKWENGNPQSVAKAKNLLADVLTFQNQHIMNWGTGNPEPKPGVYDWNDLDRRINLIRSMHSVPILTLCSAPGWMNTTGDDAPKQIDTNHWEDARVKDEHVNDYAELCKKAALRYTDIKYFQVWNEFKGYWTDSGVDYVRFTNFYNAVYDAIKSVRPDAKVGGPYATAVSETWDAIDYWFKHKHGADFVCFDGWIAGYPPTDEESQETKKMALTDYFGKLTDQFRERTKLPIWISEFYGGWSTNPQFTAANHASCYLHALLSGASLALLWGPAEQEWNYLFTNTKIAGGGKPSPHYQVVKIFNKNFGHGTKLYKTNSSSNYLEVLASSSKTLLINKRDESVSVSLNGRLIRMTPYEVRVVNAQRN